MAKGKDAKPFLKWAGGKSQLIKDYFYFYPEELIQGKVKRYIEPFVGSGAVLFDILQKFDIEEAIIIDNNPELMITYEAIQKAVNPLIEYLSELEEKYLNLDISGRKEFYYQVRSNFNNQLDTFDFNNFDENTIKRASQLIFLNRTCFNGLFRVNKSGKFNVPMGNYRTPTICHTKNLLAVSEALQRVQIHQGNYQISKKFVDNETFIYFDPPYRPLNKTSSFTSYCKSSFTDEEQIELGNFFRKLNEKEALLMLSNSDPRNTNKDDSFFDELFKGFSINNVMARRAINSDASKRGTVSELVITNYQVKLERESNEIYQAI